MGPGGPVALNHLVLFHHMDRMHLRPDQYDELFSDFQVMEAEALRCAAERADERARRAKH